MATSLPDNNTILQNEKVSFRISSINPLFKLSKKLFSPFVDKRKTVYKFQNHLVGQDKSQPQAISATFPPIPWSRVYLKTENSFGRILPPTIYTEKIFPIPIYTKHFRNFLSQIYEASSFLVV